MVRGGQQPAAVELIPRQPRRLGEDDAAAFIPDWLDPAAQQRLLQACRQWAAGPDGMPHTTLPRGGVMSVRTVCLGWRWYAYGYSATLSDGVTPVEPMPEWLAEWGRAAVALTHPEQAADYRPDVALVNFYDTTAKMGLHTDSDEVSWAPVVSLSLGDTARFRFGNTAGRTRPWTDLELESGDLFVFGGAARMAYHGVLGTNTGTAPPELGLQGRLNITLRQSGLDRR